MLFWPKKILTLFFLPLQFAIIAGVLGLILLHLRRRERLARILLTAAIAVLVIFSNKGVARALIGPLESRFPAAPEFSAGSPPPPNIAACRYVVILGGGHGESAALSRVNQLSPAALGRLAEGIRIFRQLSPDASFVVSGHAGEGNTTHAKVLADAAISLGVPSSRITRFDTPRDTHDEALAIRALAGDSPVALVTSAWHLPRAMSLCKGANLRVVPCPADFMLKPGADTGAELLLFDLGSLERSTKAIREYLGLLWSSARGQT